MNQQPAVPAVIALVAPVLSWWWHRGLRRAADHAVLPERVASVNQRVSAVTAACATVIVMGGGWHTLWALPVLFIGVAAAAYPTRRLLFGETWPFRRYLGWRVRIVVAGLGLFLLLGASPAMLLAAPAGARGWAAAALLTVLLAWHHRYAGVLLRIVGAKRLDRSDLDAAFAPVLARSTAPPPTLWRAGPEGGVIANAVAMPGLPGGRVLFFDTLLERLSPHEAAAICAHEVAHLEYFNARRVRQGYAVMVVAIAATLGVGLTVAEWAGGSLAWLAYAWPVGVLVALAARASRMQANETASDLRACELCGDPEALVSALTRLHAIHHVPRRWSVQVEHHASHPSLARRIRAIRAASPRTEVQWLTEPIVVWSADPGRAAVFERDRLAFTWTDPKAPAPPDPRPLARRLEAIAYEELVELRVAAAAGGAALVARARNGASWTMPLGPEQIAPTQVALNTVDQLVAPAAPAARAGGSRRLAAVLALAMAAALSSVFSILMPALLALLRPTRSALAAALAASGLVVDSGSGVGPIRALVFALLGAVALWQARAQAEDDDVPVPRMRSWAEGLWLALPLAVGAFWIVGGNRYDLFGLHTTARDAAWLAASAAALTGYLAVSSVRRHRRLSVGAAVLAVAVLWLGSSSFLTAVVRDPLAVDMPVLAVRSEPLTQIAEAPVSGLFARIRLTRDGRYFLLSQYDADDYPEDDEPQRHVVGAFDGWSRAIESAEAAFIDDGHLLIVERDAGAARLRAEPVREAAASWALSLPGVDPLRVRTGSGGRWEVMHRARDGFARIAGRVGAASVERTGWHVDTAPEEYVMQHVHDGSGNAIAVTSDWNGPLLPWLTFGWRSRASLLHVSPGSASRLATSDLTVRCAEPSIGAGRAVCVAFDGRVSRFWEYDAARRTFQPRGQTRGMVFSLVHDSGRAFAAVMRNGAALVDLDAGEIVTFQGALARIGMDVATASGFVVSASIEGDRTIVTLHRARELVSTP